MLLITYTIVGVMKRIGSTARESEIMIQLTYKKAREILIAQREGLMTRKSLAEELETQPSTALRYENGTYIMNIPMFMKVCQILGLDFIEVLKSARKQAKIELKKRALNLKGED